MCDVATPSEHVIEASDEQTRSAVAESMIVHEDFLTSEEESSLLSEILPYMEKLRYEYDHWDDVSYFS